jgi:hypothetical protein
VKSLPPLIWLTFPDCDGWWIAARPNGRMADISLIEVRSGLCFDELGKQCGMPSTSEFHGAHWLGPVHRPPV